MNQELIERLALQAGVDVRLMIPREIAMLRGCMQAVAEECAKAAMTCPVETYCSQPYLAQSKKQREDTAAAIRAMFKEPTNDQR